MGRMTEPKAAGYTRHVGLIGDDELVNIVTSLTGWLRQLDPKGTGVLELAVPFTSLERNIVIGSHNKRHNLLVVLRTPLPVPRSGDRDEDDPIAALGDPKGPSRDELGNA